ncbi:LysE family transporter [Algihabitans albus]|uniref:LysE family transporter n=1 Tax=Algihabitans albus TaxID=2164067 RepID=UPI0013C2DB7B|nr:LysE family transporter [Algihabitans albus]
MTLYLLAAMTPGPNLLVTVQASMAGGRRSGLSVVLGIMVASMIWAAGSLLGLNLLFALAPWLHGAMMVAGGAFLIWMGLNLLRSAWRPPEMRRDGGLPARPWGWRGFRQGLLVNLANAKSAAFYSSLFAVSVPPDAPGWLIAALVGAVGLGAGCWYGSMALLVTLPPVAQLYRRAERGLTALSGLVFMGFGIKLLAGRA